MSADARLFTDEYLAILAAVTERLIPGDETDPGAREAGVIDYILRGLGSEYAPLVPVYINGLSGLRDYAQKERAEPFVALPVSAQDELLRGIEKGDGGETLAAFFQLVLKHSMEGMFGDPRWGGNRDYAGWKLLGYPGPQYEWTLEEQQLDVVLEPRYGDLEPDKD